MPNNATRLDDKHVIVRQPNSQGAIVYKMAGSGMLVPDELHDHPDTVFQSVPDASALTDKSVDRSGIDPDSELADLMREHWDIEDFG